MSWCHLHILLRKCITLQYPADVTYHDLVCMLMEFANVSVSYCVMACSQLCPASSWDYGILGWYGVCPRHWHVILIVLFKGHPEFLDICLSFHCHTQDPRLFLFFSLIFSFSSFSGTMDVWTWSRNSSLQVPPRLAVLVSPANTCSVDFGWIG